MVFKLYLTIELPDVFEDKDTAMDAAVAALQEAVVAYAEGEIPLKPIQCRVFEDDSITSGADHSFIVDIHDGAI